MLVGNSKPKQSEANVNKRLSDGKTKKNSKVKSFS